jgi:hypothetical protein
VIDSPGTGRDKSVNRIAVRRPCYIHSGFVACAESPCPAQRRPGPVQRIERSQEIRFSGQDLKASFRQAVCPDVPFGDYIVCYMLSFFPDAVPLILRQSDDRSALFQQEPCVSFLPFGSAH